MDALLNSTYFTNIFAKPEQYRYGTAGFRMTANLMPAAACRLGPVFVERAHQLRQQLTVAAHLRVLDAALPPHLQLRRLPLRVHRIRGARGVHAAGDAEADA